MRRNLLVAFLLALCLALGLGWFVTAQRYSARFSRLSLGATPAVATQIKTNVIVRKQFFSWAEIESDDYPTYIANMRDIKVPEQTIRDIIIADVNALYSRKRSLEILSPDQQWWRPDPDPELLRAAIAGLQALESERKMLLTQLLGPGWEGGDMVSLPRPSRPGISLDGPVLGALPEEVKKTVQLIIAKYQDSVSAVKTQAAAAGVPIDRQELLRLYRRMRTDLASVLSPTQYEEFLLRYSDTAVTLRKQLAALKHFNATPDEFRAMFRASDDVEQQLYLLGDASDPDTAQRRAALLEQRDNAIRMALSPERYREYQLLHDDSFQQAYADAQKADSPEAAPVLYEINQAAATELAAIQSNTNLSELQRAIELKKAELAQLQASAAALGEAPLEEPAPAPTPTEHPNTFEHVFSNTDSPNSIAQHYGISLDTLQNANPGIDLTHLRPGETLNIPNPAPPLHPPVRPTQPY